MEGRFRSSLDIFTPPLTLPDPTTGNLREFCLARAGVFVPGDDEKFENLAWLACEEISDMGGEPRPGTLFSAEMNSEAKNAEELQMSELRHVANLLSDKEWLSAGTAMEIPSQEGPVINKSPF